MLATAIAARRHDNQYGMTNASATITAISIAKAYVSIYTAESGRSEFTSINESGMLPLLGQTTPSRAGVITHPAALGGSTYGLSA